VYASGSRSITVVFDEPAFELAYAGPRLQRSLYLALQDVDLPGLEIGDAIRPAQWHLSASFLSFAARLSVRLNGFEVSFLNERSREPVLIKKMLHAIETSVLQFAAHASPSQREFLHQAHCKLTHAGVREKVPCQVRDLPETLGSLTGHGVGLYFTSPLFSHQANVVLDKSLILDEGLFVQVRCGFDADAFDLATSSDNFQTYLHQIDDAMHLHGILREQHE
jgi:hypothetical protein